MSLNATSALSVTTTPCSVSNAQSSSSMATPFNAPSAGVISSSCRMIGWSAPNNCPDAMRNASWYPIWPAAPVIATRTGVLLFCFMDDVCLDNDTAQPNGGRNITMCMRADRPCRRAMTSASFAVFERLLRETVLAQQAAELVVAQAQNLRRDGLL